MRAIVKVCARLDCNLPPQHSAHDLMMLVTEKTVSLSLSLSSLPGGYERMWPSNKLEWPPVARRLLACIPVPSMQQPPHPHPHPPTSSCSLYLPYQAPSWPAASQSPITTNASGGSVGWRAIGPLNEKPDHSPNSSLSLMHSCTCNALWYLQSGG